MWNCPDTTSPQAPTPFAPVEQTAEQVATEITRLGLRGVLLWGHSSGAALALETARRLETGPVPVLRVFIGAQLIGDAATRRAAADELTGQSNAAIAARLISGGGTALGGVDDQGAERVAAAYRHDCVAAHRYLAAALESPPASHLSAPVSVVLAADDPSTADFPHRHREWGVLADHVDLRVIPDGGHHFVRTRPAETAQVVLRTADLLAPPTPVLPMPLPAFAAILSPIS